MWAVWAKQQAMGQAWELKKGSRARFAGPRLPDLSLPNLDPRHGK